MWASIYVWAINASYQQTACSPHAGWFYIALAFFLLKDSRLFYFRTLWNCGELQKWPLLAWQMWTCCDMYSISITVGRWHRSEQVFTVLQLYISKWILLLIYWAVLSHFSSSQCLLIDRTACTFPYAYNPCIQANVVLCHCIGWHAALTLNLVTVNSPSF